MCVCVHICVKEKEGNVDLGKVTAEQGRRGKLRNNRWGFLKHNDSGGGGGGAKKIDQ